MRAEKNERVLVTTLTKRMAEDLAEYYTEVGVRCRYLHSEIETLERIKILRGLRRGEFDVLIGINLLREGLDLPEVSLVAILDADKEGFLRSGDSLIQTMGRAARHINGRAILYADKMTDSMKRAIDETNRRREIQERYNLENNITPESIIKPIDMTLVAIAEADYVQSAGGGSRGRRSTDDPEKIAEMIAQARDRNARGGEEIRVRARRRTARQSARVTRESAVESDAEAIWGRSGFRVSDLLGLAFLLLQGISFGKPPPETRSSIRSNTPMPRMRTRRFPAAARCRNL